MFSLKDYEISEALGIVENCTESKVRNLVHFNVRNLQRMGDVSIVYESIFSEPIVGILKQDYNKFKVFWEHKTKKSKDIYVILVINDDNGIELVTIMPDNKDKRLRCT